MRLLSLSVRNFQCIESAELEFGPGLNVLFGPNDLGKSSLAWAVRAVLLLQYSSAEHERFVSWYGGNDPTVALTLHDEERYWRVTKCFPRSASLESSHNGRDFRPEASARQTDDKLRELLRWGVHKPGGRGKPTGLPRSFLTQVLLSDQDDVRQILCDASLEDDPDQAGRARLTEALGALAQDPIFKRVLDEAQAQVDRAFTATGLRKRAAGSPFVTISAKLKQLATEKEDLDVRVRDTIAAQDRAQRLASERDQLEQALAEARGALEQAERALEKRKARDELIGRLRDYEATLQTGEILERRVSEGADRIREVEEDLASGIEFIRAAEDDLAGAEEGLARARERLDSLNRDDPALVRERHALEEEERAQIEAVQRAQSDVDRAEATVRLATSAARGVRDAAHGLGCCQIAVREAAAEAERARERAAEAKSALESAEQRLRELTSGDQARALELERKELQNRRLLAEAARSDSERILETARAVGEAVSRAAAARAAHQAQVQVATEERAKLDAAEEKRARLEGEVVSARKLSAYANLVALRRAGEMARRSRDAAAEAGARAAALRDEARALRSGVPAGLPDSEAVERLRRWNQELRVAEARLGAVSVVVRPRRSLKLHASRDGVAEPARVVTDPVGLAAQHDLVIAIDDLVEIEVAGGDDEARAAAATLRARWRDQAAPVLAQVGVATLEDLLGLRGRATEAERGAEDREREAEQLEQQARGLDETREAPEPGQFAALEAELGGADEVDMARSLAALGSDPIASLRQRLENLARQLQELTSGRDELRAAEARAQARLESIERDAEVLEETARTQEAALGQAWSVRCAEAEAAVTSAAQEIVDIDGRLSTLSSLGRTGEDRARDAVETCAGELSRDEEAMHESARAEQETREALAAQMARLEAARAHAKAVDVRGLWTAELVAGTADLSLAAFRAAVDMARAGWTEATGRLAEIRARMARLQEERSAALATARQDHSEAETEVRTARATVERLREEDRRARDEVTRLQQALVADRIELAQRDLAAARAEVVRLREALSAMEDPAAIDEAEVERRREATRRLAGELDAKKEELAEARGALEQVGGAVVRERRNDIEKALEQARLEERAVETTFEGWKLLVDTLRDAESSESTHLGRALAEPVSQRFREMTGGRYERLELGAHLETEGLRAAGELREVAALSAGTQDQLATLLRLCVAEHLRSSIILDDHLSQSDPARVAWFKNLLLDASQRVQILFITCRPLELLRPDEMPDGAAIRSSAAGLVRAIDLTRIIRRFAADRSEVARTTTDEPALPNLTTP